MDFENLHQILRSLYDEMMPLCSDMTDIAKGLAGLGALFYVALRAVSYTHLFVAKSFPSSLLIFSPLYASAPYNELPKLIFATIFPQTYGLVQQSHG